MLVHLLEMKVLNNSWSVSLINWETFFHCFRFCLYIYVFIYCNILFILTYSPVSNSTVFLVKSPCTLFLHRHNLNSIKSLKHFYVWILVMIVYKMFTGQTLIHHFLNNLTSQITNEYHFPQKMPIRTQLMILLCEVITNFPKRAVNSINNKSPRFFICHVTDVQLLWPSPKSHQDPVNTTMFLLVCSLN